MKAMTIINQKNRVLLILFFCCSCSTQKETTKHSCLKVKVESETTYEGNNQIISNNMADFNSNTDKTIDIVRILSTSGYEYKENFKRIYIKDNIVFIIEYGIQKQLSISPKILESEFLECNDLKSLVNCNVKSSQSNIYRFFVKKGNKLVMTFTANDLIKNIKDEIIKDELLYITYFEKMR